MYKCNRVKYYEEYIGESARTFGEIYKEHLKDPSLIYYHSNITGHHTGVDNFSTVRRKVKNLTRTIKEIIFYKRKWFIPKQEHWQIPTVAHVAYGSVQDSHN